MLKILRILNSIIILDVINSRLALFNRTFWPSSALSNMVDISHVQLIAEQGNCD